MQIKIKETSNGYLIDINGREYVYRYVDYIALLEHVGREIRGKKVKVADQ